MYWVLLWSIPITCTRGCGKECIIIYSKIIVSCWAVNTEQAKQKHYGKINGKAKLASLFSKQETWTLSQLPTVVTVSSFPHDRCMFNDFDRVCFFLHNWIWLYPPSRELAFKGDRKKISNVRVFSLRDAVQLLDWHSSSCAPRNIYICEQLYSTWFYLHTPSAFLHANHCCGKQNMAGKAEMCGCALGQQCTGRCSLSPLSLCSCLSLSEIEPSDKRLWLHHECVCYDREDCVFVY